MRLVPQRLAELWCGRRGHPRTRYSAVNENGSCVVETCRCGKEQIAAVYTGVRFPRPR